MIIPAIKSYAAIALVIAILGIASNALHTYAKLGRLEGKIITLNADLKYYADLNKSLGVELKTAKKDLLEVKKDYDAACVVNDTLVARYSAFYKKITGKELKAKDLRVVRRGR